MLVVVAVVVAPLLVAQAVMAAVVMVVHLRPQVLLALLTQVVVAVVSWA
jgi:hypothetical protein